MDVSKLTPLPWYAVAVDTDEGSFDVRSPRYEIGNIESKVDAEFFVLARQAFDVMMRRPWGVECIFWGEGERAFQAVDECDDPIGDTQANDPWTALIKADEWYKANRDK